MILFLTSLLSLGAVLVLQRIPGGNAVDVITPLIVAVGLGTSMRRSVPWACVMGAVWSVFVNFHPAALIALWCAVMLVLGVVARGTEWEKPVVGATIAAVTAVVWRIGALLIGWFGGSPPTIDRYALLSFAARPLTAGLLFLLVGVPLAHALRPERLR
jgi:hypothetical protein